MTLVECWYCMLHNMFNNKYKRAQWRSAGNLYCFWMLLLLSYNYWHCLNLGLRKSIMYQTESSLPSLRCSKREKSWEFFGTLWFSKQGETILWRAGEEAIGDRQSGQWKVINFDMITALSFRPILRKLAVVSSLRLFLPIRRLQATALESRRDVSGIHFRRGQCYDDAQWAVCILRPVTFTSNCLPVWVLPRLMILGSFRGNGTPDLWGACDKLRGATDSVPLFAYVNPIRVHRCRGGSLAVGMGWGISVNQPPKMTNKYIWAKKNKRKTKKLSRHLSLRGRIVEESFEE